MMSACLAQSTGPFKCAGCALVPVNLAYSLSCFGQNVCMPDIAFVRNASHSCRHSLWKKP